MTKFKILAAVAAVVLAVGALSTDSFAQQNYTGAAAQSQQVRSTVALLDVGYVFKQNAHFNALKENLKLELQRADAQMKAERDSIIERAKALKELKIGTPDYKQLESQIANMQAALQVKVQLMKKELMTKEAKIYHQVYTEICQEVEVIAQQYGFAAVIQFNGDQATPENPEAIMRHISRPIVWHNASLDITPRVLERLNARSGGTATSNSRQGLPAQPRR